MISILLMPAIWTVDRDGIFFHEFYSKLNFVLNMLYIYIYIDATIQIHVVCQFKFVTFSWNFIFNLIR